MIRLFLFLVLSGSAALADDAELAKLFPNPEALSSWRDSRSTKNQNLDAIPKIPFACDKGGLFPTHPQQSTKEYVAHRIGRYDEKKLEADDHPCTIGQRSSGPGPKNCLRASAAEVWVVSDLYLDRCGNIYRAYWRKAFLTKDDNDGQLWSQGRWLSASPGFRYVTEPTYEVTKDTFLFFTKPSERDLQEIERLKNAASKDGMRWNEKTLLFDRPATDEPAESGSRAPLPSL